MIRQLLIGLFIGMAGLRPSGAHANVVYTPADSIRVETLLAEGRLAAPTTNWMLFYGRKLIGTPYVAQTLEHYPTERLIINLRQLDCTTFVENVLALSVCTRQQQFSFRDFCHALRQIRYRGGVVDYPTRLHYFSDWITDNEQAGFVKERQAESAPFTARQTFSLNYMSTHAAQYPMLKGNTAWLETIRESEQRLTGKHIYYIPKSQLRNTAACRQHIHDGDIIAIVTSKKGLDTSHIGIAVWQRDGLHLLNASLIRKRVVEEPMTMSAYMAKHPSQIGIRVIEVR